jgi:hypothetical protein
MKRLRPDGASLKRRSRNASGPQPGTLRIEIECQGLELFGRCRVFRDFAYAGPSAGGSVDTDVTQANSDHPHG